LVRGVTLHDVEAQRRAALQHLLLWSSSTAIAALAAGLHAEGSITLGADETDWVVLLALLFVHLCFSWPPWVIPHTTLRNLYRDWAPDETPADFVGPDGEHVRLKARRELASCFVVLGYSRGDALRAVRLWTALLAGSLALVLVA
jgi:hypothetical protein